MNWQIASTDVRDDGLVGKLFLPAGTPPYPVVITLGGSGGGIFTAPSAMLASREIASLALAYFGMEHLPRELKRIPLEYFETAIQWCRRHDELRADAIGLAGGSRGGELALLVAATYSEIAAVVGWSPSGVVWGGMQRDRNEAPVSAWTLQGKDLPFVPFDKTAVDWTMRPVRFTPGFISGLSDEASVTAAEIPVERINGPVLLISGSDDQVWPSRILSEIAVRRLKAAGHAFVVEHLNYEGAGHAIGPPHPYVSRAPTHFTHPLTGIDFEMGGTPEWNARASSESWQRVITFFQDRFAVVV
jgi:dienelactone hydrolase